MSRTTQSKVPRTGAPRIFITRKIPKAGFKILDDAGIDYDVFPHSETPPTKEEIIEGVRECDGLISLLTDPIDGDVLRASDRLKAVCQYAVGYNNIDLEEAKRLGITVTNTPKVLTETTADLAWALMLAAARRIVESDRYMREGKFKGWAPLLHPGEDVHGKILGIVGAGRIGSAVGRRAKGFDMRIIYHNRHPNPEFERETGARIVDIDTLLREADFISVHTPLTPETEHMFGEREFRLMKKSAVFVNTGRGKCVDEKALIRALKTGEIRAAGLDVFENEPALTPGLSELVNVVLAAHIGSASRETRAKMAEIAAGDMVSILNGRKPVHRVV